MSGTAFDWTNKSSYQKSATNVSGYDSAPQAGDRIVLGENVKASITMGTADATLVKSMTKVILYAGAELTITADSDAEWESAIVESGTSRTAKVVKRGSGNLSLMSYNTTQTYTASKEWQDYLVGWDIQAGTLTMVNCLEQSRNRWVNAINVAEGATFDPGTGTGSSGGTVVLFGPLSGKGTIKKADDSTKSVLEFRTGTAQSTFDGVITGNIQILLYGSKLDLTGIKNDFKGGETVFQELSGRRPVLGFTCMGGESGDSSVGYKGFSMSVPGTLKYIGYPDARTTYGSKGCYWIGWNPVLDGGAYGGLKCNNTFGMQSTYPKNTAFTFTGSNQVECIFSGPFNEKTDSSGNKVSARFIKEGTGIWRLADNLSRKNGGVIEVNEGTLRFESIAEIGTICSLGRADALFESYEGAYDETKKVAHAFELGSTSATEYPATMEYVGTASATVTTRTFALKGEGRLRTAADAGKLDITGFGLLAGQSSATLHLDALNTGKANFARDVDAGSGTINLVKDGAGAWTLAGKLAGVGGIAVNAGTLNYKNNENYEYYRIVIKGAYSEPGGNYYSYAEFGEVGLFDKDGYRQNLGLTYDSGHDVDALQPGRFMMIDYAGTKSVGYDRAPNGMFDDATSNLVNKSGNTCGNSVQIQSATGSRYLVESNSTWSCIVMRLPSLKTNPVVAFDMVASYGQNYQYGLSVWSLEGSVDGHSWTEVCNSTDVGFTRPGAVGRWYKKGTYYSAGDTAAGKTKTDNWPVASYAAHDVTSSGLSLSVSPSATLNLGSPITVNKLTIDVSTGFGDVEGVTLEESGVLELTGVETRSGAIDVPGVNVVDNPGFASIVNWSVSINGRATSRKVNVDSDGNVKVMPCGFLFLLR